MGKQLVDDILKWTLDINGKPAMKELGNLEQSTYSLEKKTLIRIDLDPNLRKAWEFQNKSSEVQTAIDKGLPKTKLMSIPFRMEMSGFARLDKSIPLVADIGIAWPIIAWRLEKELGISLDFMSYPQQNPEGQGMRKWIVDNIRPIEKKKLLSH